MLAHTYRDECAIERPRTDLIDDWIWSFIVVVFAVGALLGALGDRGLVQIGAAIFWFSLAVAVARYSHFRRYYRMCLEIRLDDDGACELDTRRPTIRLHARQIRTVEARYDDEGNRESYVIRSDVGNLVVSGRIIGFGDFVMRLKQANPAVKLRGFPGSQ